MLSQLCLRTYHKYDFTAQRWQRKIDFPISEMIEQQKRNFESLKYWTLASNVCKSLNNWDTWKNRYLQIIIINIVWYKRFGSKIICEADEQLHYCVTFWSEKDWNIKLRVIRIYFEEIEIFSLVIMYEKNLQLRCNLITQF